MKTSTHTRPIVYCTAVIDKVEHPATWVSRVTLVGDGLADYVPARPAEAFRLLLPPSPTDPVVFPGTGADGLPVWRPQDPRPTLRGFTVVSHEPGAIVFDVMDRKDSRWPNELSPGRDVGVAGMRFGYHATGEAGRHVLVGDRSGLPAVRAALDGVPSGESVLAVLMGVGDPAERALLGSRPGLDAQWFGEHDLDAVISAVSGFDADHVMAVGEVQLVGDVYRSMIARRGPERLQPIVYWQRGMGADQRDPLVYSRYQEAAARGLDVGDPRRVADLELTPVTSPAVGEDTHAG